jgi:hypothetical protein
MRELPIIFSAEMVKAILDGRKTQTRRIIKPQPTKIVSDWSSSAEIGEAVIYRGLPCILKESRGRNKRDAGELTPKEIKPKYQVGDRFWVKEGFQILTKRAESDNFYGRKVSGYYLADDSYFDRIELQQEEWDLWESRKYPYRKTSGRFMYKSLARLWLEVTNVRVERLQDINITDIQKEGIFWDEDTMITDFQKLWDSLNAKRGYSWQSNPWIWVMEFKRIK